MRQGNIWYSVDKKILGGPSKYTTKATRTVLGSCNTGAGVDVGNGMLCAYLEPKPARMQLGQKFSICGANVCNEYTNAKLN